jgi:DNA polymerase (family 10)
MPVHNEDIARHFEEIADLLEIQGANPFRVRAYRNGARAVRALGRSLADLVEEGADLSALPDIGDALAKKIVELLQSGTTEAMSQLHKELPASLEDLLRIPTLGPKRVKALFSDLGIKTLAQLERAAKAGKVRGLPGFGSRTEAKILESLTAHRTKKQRMLLATAVDYAEPLVTYLQRTSGVDQVIVAGSYRRGRETVGDLDILVTAPKGSKLMSRFVDYDEVAEVVSEGTTRSSALLRSGLQVDLRLVPPDSLGAALHYFTGSKAHNIQLRRLGQQRGLKINEYGVFKGKRRVAGEDEPSVFAAVGLPWIPPELREGGDELEAAAAGRLPDLIESDDLRGELHCHTNATDGHASLREMVHAAKGHGLKYLAITDHSQRLTMVHGLDVKRLRRQLSEIDALNAELRGITVLKGIECDILGDGRLDLPDEILGELDLVIGAVHYKFNLPRNKQTERILRAMDNRYFSILAHPTGRLLEEREPYSVDLERIIAHAAERGCFLELNSQPRRLDLDATGCRMARDAGVLVAINTDAHSVNDLDHRRFGIGQARRGWLEKDHVLNTRGLRELSKLLARTMG